MDAFTTYNFTIEGTNEKIKAIEAVIKNTVKDVAVEADGNEIHIDETYDAVFEDEVLALIKSAAKAAGNETSFTVTGIIDTSSTAAELMDFRFTWKDGVLTSQYSDWYLETGMSSYESIEEFRECFFEDCSPEQWEVFKNFDVLYEIEGPEYNVYSDHVSLHEPKIEEI